MRGAEAADGIWREAEGGLYSGHGAPRLCTVVVRVCVCIPAMSSVSMRGGGWGGLNSLLTSSSGSGGSPLL